MREIKFRWFHKKSGKMTDWNTVLKECDRLSFLLPSEDWEVMQFTGLLDKNGKEIYEGDFLEWKNGDFGRVVWNSEFGSWLIGLGKISTPRINWHNAKIVGNIFENKK